MKTNTSEIDAFVEGLPIGIVVFDKGGAVVTVNDRAVELLGLTLESLMAQPIHEAIAETGLKEIIEHLRQGGVERARTSAIIGGRYLSCSGQVTHMDDGLRVVLTVEDATDVRRLDQIKRDFVGTLLHKLRSPTSTLKTSLAILDSTESGRMSADGAEVLRMCTHEIDRLNNLLNCLRDLFLVEANLVAQDLEPETFPVGKALSAARDRLRREHPAAEECLRINGATGSSVVGDYQKLKRVFEILLDNAAVFSPADAPIEITVDRGPEMVSVHVKDMGIGVSSQEQRQLFCKYSRVDNEVTRQVDGNGLGLFLARSWLDLMGGSIACESVPNKGTTMTVTIPIPVGSTL